MNERKFLCPKCFKLVDSFRLIIRTDTEVEVVIENGEVREINNLQNEDIGEEFLKCYDCGEFIDTIYSSNAEDYVVEIDNGKLIPIGDYWKEHKEELEEVEV
ncbi:MAG: hypothetical protein J7L15_07565 [Clostridiales bacterium]|nr:hypothetical protein [Clostridiales bacterium]